MKQGQTGGESGRYDISKGASREMARQPEARRRSSAPSLDAKSRRSVSRETDCCEAVDPPGMPWLTGKQSLRFTQKHTTAALFHVKHPTGSQAANRDSMAA